MPQSLLASCLNGSEGFPARDIWFLHTVPQGPYQMGRVVGTPPPSPPSLEIQVDIQARELYLEFVPMDLDSDETPRDIDTAVLHRISIPFIWAEWFGLGSHS